MQININILERVFVLSNERGKPCSRKSLLVTMCAWFYITGSCSRASWWGQDVYRPPRSPRDCGQSWMSDSSHSAVLQACDVMWKNSCNRVTQYAIFIKQQNCRRRQIRVNLVTYCKTRRADWSVVTLGILTYRCAWLSVLQHWHSDRQCNHQRRKLASCNLRTYAKQAVQIAVPYVLC